MAKTKQKQNCCLNECSHKVRNSSYPLLLRPDRGLLFLPKLFLSSPHPTIWKRTWHLRGHFLGRCTQVFHVWDLRVITDSDLRDQSERTCFSHCLPAGRRLRGDEEKGRDISVIKPDWGLKRESHTQIHTTHRNPHECVCHMNCYRCNSASHTKVILCCQNAEQHSPDTNRPVLWKLWFKKEEERFSSKTTLSLKKQQRPLKKSKNERKRRKRGQREGRKLSRVRLRKVHPARDVDECASGFKLALQPPAVWIPCLR